MVQHAHPLHNLSAGKYMCMFSIRCKVKFNYVWHGSTTNYSFLESNSTLGGPFTLYELEYSSNVCKEIWLPQKS